MNATTEKTMNAAELRNLQAPLKEKYKSAPGAALITLKAQGELDALGIACKVDTGRAIVEAGLHPATGGDGSQACSGDMLLEALVACAGVVTSTASIASGAIYSQVGERVYYLMAAMALAAALIMWLSRHRLAPQPSGERPDG